MPQIIVCAKKKDHRLNPLALSECSAELEERHSFSGPLPCQRSKASNRKLESGPQPGTRAETSGSSSNSDRQSILQRHSTRSELLSLFPWDFSPYFIFVQTS
jgi:hypothetical protein